MKAGAEVSQKPWENPLVPHRRLREIFRMIAGARLREMGRRRPRRPGGGGFGEEACRASVYVGLGKGDLVLDHGVSPGAAWMITDRVNGGRRLEIGADAASALWTGMGAAMTSLPAKQQRVTVVAVRSGSVSTAVWAEVLELAGRVEAPILFLVLPPAPAEAKRLMRHMGELSERSTQLKVPGIPVAAEDAVALYRVAQESFVRIRRGGGPVLMECVHLGTEAMDPLAHMRGVLVSKGAADRRWIEQAEARLRGEMEDVGGHGT